MDGQIYVVTIRCYLSLDFIIQELFLELGESIVTTVIIQVERIQHIPRGGRMAVVAVKSRSKRANAFCHCMFSLTPSWRAPWSPGCGP